MQALSGAVGDGAANAVHDVALVQAILVKITRPAVAAAPGVVARVAAPYLASYDGACGRLTKAAIRAFQTDNALLTVNGQQTVAAANVTAGQVIAGDATWAALIAQVPADFANLRVLTNGNKVYIEATATQLQARIAAVGALTFAPAFRVKVLACINQMHSLHGIAVGVCAQGDRRTFQAQYALLTSGRGVTNAGPGESNHNFGMATDIGFAGLRWLHANGDVDNNETSWLHHLTATSSTEANRFWDTLRTVGTSTAVGAFRGPVGDRPHLQNWNDANVSMTARLAVHLQASGTMRWGRANGVYTCDLGLGGAMYPVGTAAQIWNLQATITAVQITQARAAAAAAAAQAAGPGGGAARPGAAPQQPGQARGGAQPPAGARGGAGVPPVAAATPADVVAMRQALRNQFDLADTNWQNWTPN